MIAIIQTSYDPLCCRFLVIEVEVEVYVTVVTGVLGNFEQLIVRIKTLLSLCSASVGTGQAHGQGRMS